MAGSLSAVDLVSARTEDLKYIQALTVNVSNFVSVKLSGRSNYEVWHAQMLCLIESQVLLYIINAEHPFPEDKGVHMISQYDKLVKGWIFGSLNEIVLKNFIYLGTARDVWRILEEVYSYPPIRDAEDDSLRFRARRDLLLVPELENTDRTRLKEELYDAAVEGCWWKAKSILKIHKNAAREAITETNNTILHVAVEMGNDYFVEQLLKFSEDRDDVVAKNSYGRTALHIAAMVDNTYAANLLIHKRMDLLLMLDNKAESPLDVALFNTNMNISVYLMRYQEAVEVHPRNFAKAITSAIYTRHYDIAAELLYNYADIAVENDDILFTLAITFPAELGVMESLIYPNFKNCLNRIFSRGILLFHSNFLDVCADEILRIVKIFNNTCCMWLGKNSLILLVATLYPIYKLIYLLIMVLYLPFSMLYFLLWKVLAVTVPPIKNIEKKKMEHQEAKLILSKICDMGGTSHYGYTKSIIGAIREGAYEVVDEILFTSPAMSNYKDVEGYNFIQLAIINRSEKVYNLIYPIIGRRESYRRMRDSSENNLAHLVGRLPPSNILGCTAGAAMQLQRELLWREEIKRIMLPMDLVKENIYGETPEMVFTREHQDLVKHGQDWMKTTAESCSITAALIVTIVFAAAITVPGGSNQESGIPVFKKEIAFTIFAMSNAFSLFTATTSLLLFLSILIARFSEIDFLVNLPRRLIFGLVMLFLSTTTMIVAFGAILFLVFCDQRPWMLAPIFGFACLPISVMVTIKLPLLADLIQSTYFPILGRKSTVEYCKTNRKNTVFLD